MKKILLIVLALALMLSLCAGCNNSRIDDDFDDGPITINIGGAPDDDVDDADDPVVEEPADVEEPDDADEEPDDPPVKEPVEVPPYPFGEIEEIEQEENDGYTITIINTSLADMEKYAAMMIDDGWKSDGIEDVGFSLIVTFNKGDKAVMLVLLEKEATLFIKVRIVFEEQVLPNVWPAGYLPQGFPEYPDGEITRAEIFLGGSLSFDIEGTSKETYDKYVASLIDAGWKIENKVTDIVVHEGKEYEYECYYLETDRGLCGVSIIDKLGYVSIYVISTF